MSPVKPTLVTFVAVALTWLTYFGLFSYEVLVLEDWQIVLVAIGALAFVAPLSTYKKVKQTGQHSYTRNILGIVAASVTVYLLAWLI